MTVILPHADLVDLARRSFTLMEEWDDAEAERVIHQDSVNHEAASEPPAARATGPAGYRATYDWLHSAYAEIGFDVRHVAADGDLAVADVVMSGVQTGPFVVYDANGRVDQVFPSRGRRFAVSQSHWYRIRDGKIAEHWANRDDLGQAVQLGWVPPSPAFLLRGALLKRRLRRSA